MSLQTGRVSFLGTELITAPDSEHAEPVSQLLRQRGRTGELESLWAGTRAGQLGSWDGAPW